MLKNKTDIKNWLNKCKVKNYTINDDFTVDVEGGVNLDYKKLTHIPVQFGSVTGSFYCMHNQLITLEGCPHIVGGDFSCSRNKLTNLLGSPKTVSGNFSCYENTLNTLQGGPRYVKANFYCFKNPIIDLNDFHCEFSGTFYHTGSIIEDFSEFYIEDQLKLTHKEIQNIKLNNKLNDIIKDKIETINTISKNKL